MRASHIIGIVSTFVTLGLAASCDVDPDDFGQSEIAESGDESADGEEPQFRDREVRPTESATAAKLEKKPPCFGGCNNPPSCHIGPGECIDGACWYPPAFSGTICEGAQCFINECIGGGCTPYTPLPEGFPCDDGDESTVDDECNAEGFCEGVIPCLEACDAPPPCHSGPGQCISSSYGNSCWYPPMLNGSICDNGVQCMYAECIGGACVSRVNKWNGTPCDDGNACTTEDQCDGEGSCVGELNPPCPITAPPWQHLPAG